MMKCLRSTVVCALSVLIGVPAFAEAAAPETHDDNSVLTVETPPKDVATPKWHFNPEESDPNCIQDPSDPGDYGAKVVAPNFLGLFGHKNRCIDMSERRPVVILTPEEAARFNPAPGEIVLGNVSQIVNGKKIFGVVKVKPEDIEPGYVWLEHFDEHLKGKNPLKKLVRKLSWGISHIATVVPFKQPIPFFPYNGRAGEKPLSIPFVVLSGEAVPVRGASKLLQKTLFLQGLKPQAMSPFVATPRVTSGSYKKEEMLEKLNRSVDLLPLNAEFTRRFTQNYFKMGEEIRMRPMYQTAGAHSLTCVDLWLQATEASLTDPQKGARERKAMRHNPGRLVKALVASDMIGEGPIMQLNRDGKKTVGPDDLSVTMSEGLESLWDLSKYDITFGNEAEQLLKKR